MAILVVSGLPHPGISMMMSMLEVGGVEVVTDQIREADVDNPKGYHEFEPVKNLQMEDNTSWLKIARGKGSKTFLQKRLDVERMASVIDKRLYRNRT